MLIVIAVLTANPLQIVLPRVLQPLKHSPSFTAELVASDLSSQVEYFLVHYDRGLLLLTNSYKCDFKRLPVSCWRWAGPRILIMLIVDYETVGSGRH